MSLPDRPPLSPRCTCAPWAMCALCEEAEALDVERARDEGTICVWCDERPGEPRGIGYECEECHRARVLRELVGGV